MDPGAQHFTGAAGVGVGGSNFFQGGGVQMLISIETHIARYMLMFFQATGLVTGVYIVTMH